MSKDFNGIVWQDESSAPLRQWKIFFLRGERGEKEIAAYTMDGELSRGVGLEFYPGDERLTKIALSRQLGCKRRDIGVKTQNRRFF